MNPIGIDCQGDICGYRNLFFPLSASEGIRTAKSTLRMFHIATSRGPRLSHISIFFGGGVEAVQFTQPSADLSTAQEAVQIRA